MPLYNIACRRPLRPEQRRAVASGVTEAHCAATTALPHYVNVIFNDHWDLPAGIDISIFGGVRIGGTRTPEAVQRLKRCLVEATAVAIGLPMERVAISTVGFPAHWIIEGGVVMPAPGAEPGAAERLKQQDSVSGSAIHTEGGSARSAL